MSNKWNSIRSRVTKWWFGSTLDSGSSETTKSQEEKMASSGSSSRSTKKPSRSRKLTEAGQWVESHLQTWHTTYGMLSPAKRVPDGPLTTLSPGEFQHVWIDSPPHLKPGQAPHWEWYLCAPNGTLGRATSPPHTITENFDGTVSFSPSLWFDRGKPKEWHGFLIRSNWEGWDESPSASKDQHHTGSVERFYPRRTYYPSIRHYGAEKEWAKRWTHVSRP